MREVPLTLGQVALIDDEDWAAISPFKWHAQWNPWSKTHYAVRVDYRCRKKLVLMHRLVMRFPDQGLHVDHKDGNGLNNVRSNLRLATKTENARNLPRHRANNTSGYRGVSLDKRYNRWRARAGKNGSVFLGLYSTREEAARAFDAYVLANWGEFAGELNFPLEAV